MTKSQGTFPAPGDSTCAVILAAGKGTRMNAREPKAAVPVGGKPMVVRVVDAVRGAGISRIVVVVGHGADDVRAAIGDSVEYVVQEDQLGTGHATQCAHAALQSFKGTVLVAYADIPLLPKGEVARLVARHIESGAAATLLTAVLDEPGALGRITRTSDGGVAGIVEARDASEEQLAIKEINVGVYCFEAPLLFDLLSEVGDENAQHQFYLTDTMEILLRRGERVEALALESAHRGMGVNTVHDLAKAERHCMTGDAV